MNFFYAKSESQYVTSAIYWIPAIETKKFILTYDNCVVLLRTTLLKHHPVDIAINGQQVYCVNGNTNVDFKLILIV